MYTLNQKKKKLKVEQDYSTQSKEMLEEIEEDEEEIPLNEVDKYETSFFDPTLEEIEMEKDMLDLLKSIDDEWSSLVK